MEEVVESSPYTSYTGSLNRPACTEDVQWFIFHQPIKISSDQLETFRTLRAAGDGPLKDNSRSLQSSEEREFIRIDSSVARPRSREYERSRNCVKKVVSGQYFDQRFRVENVYSHLQQETEGSFWLGPTGRTGEFVLDLGCEERRRVVELVNTNGGRRTRQFRVSSSESHEGPFTELMEGVLEDGRQTFYFSSNLHQFFKFEIISWHGLGGGLHYFDVKGCVAGANCAAGLFYRVRMTMMMLMMIMMMMMFRTTTAWL